MIYSGSKKASFLIADSIYVAYKFLVNVVLCKRESSMWCMDEQKPCNLYPLILSNLNKVENGAFVHFGTLVTALTVGLDFMHYWPTSLPIEVRDGVDIHVAPRHRNNIQIMNTTPAVEEGAVRPDRHCRPRIPNVSDLAGYGSEHYAWINTGMSNVNWNALAERNIDSQVWTYDQLNEQTVMLNALTVDMTRMRTDLNAFGARFDAWQTRFPSLSRGPMPPPNQDNN